MDFENPNLYPPTPIEKEKDQNLIPQSDIGKKEFHDEDGGRTSLEIKNHEPKIVEFQILLNNLERLGPWWTTLVAEIKINVTEDEEPVSSSDLVNLSGMGYKLKSLLERIGSSQVEVSYLGYHENNTSEQIDVTNDLTEKGDIRNLAWQEFDERRKVRALLRQQR